MQMISPESINTVFIQKELFLNIDFEKFQVDEKK